MWIEVTHPGIGHVHVQLVRDPAVRIRLVYERRGRETFVHARTVVSILYV